MYDNPKDFIRDIELMKVIWQGIQSLNLTTIIAELEKWQQREGESPHSAEYNKVMEYVDSCENGLRAMLALQNVLSGQNTGGKLVQEMYKAIMLAGEWIQGAVVSVEPGRAGSTDHILSVLDKVRQDYEDMSSGKETNSDG